MRRRGFAAWRIRRARGMGNRLRQRNGARVPDERPDRYKQEQRQHYTARQNTFTEHNIRKQLLPLANGVWNREPTIF